MMMMPKRSDNPLEGEFSRNTVHGLNIHELSERAGITERELIDGLLPAHSIRRDKSNQALVIACGIGNQEENDDASEDEALHRFEQLIVQLYGLGMTRIYCCLPDTELGRQTRQIVHRSEYLKNRCHRATISAGVHPFDANASDSFGLEELISAKEFLNDSMPNRSNNTFWLIKKTSTLSFGTIERIRDLYENKSAFSGSDLIQLVSDDIYHIDRQFFIESIERAVRINPKLISEYQLTLENLLDGTFQSVKPHHHYYWSCESLTDEAFDGKERFVALPIESVRDRPNNSEMMKMNQENIPLLSSHHQTTPILVEKKYFDELIEVTTLSESDLDHLISDIRHENDRVGNQAFLVAIDNKPLEYSWSDQNHQKKDIVVVFPEQLCAVAKSCQEKITPALATRRRRSILPSDVKEIRLEAHVSAGHSYGTRTNLPHDLASVQLIVNKQVPLIGYVILTTALFSVSSQGAVFQLLVGVPPLIRLFWRLFGASVAFLPLFIVTIREKRQSLSFDQNVWKPLLACMVAYLIQSSAFLTSLSMTSIGHVYIFCNCHSLLIVAGKLLVFQQLPKLLELIGAALGFAGIIITTLDHGQGIDPGRESSVSGDLVAIAGACAAVVYLMSASKTRGSMDIGIFIFLLVTTGWLLLVPVLALLANTTEMYQSVSIWDSREGLFGWVHHLSIEFYIVIIGSFAGTMGFILSMKYFDPLAISVTMLLQPIVATSIGIVMGLTDVPGLFTLVGGSIMIIGCGLVIKTAHSTSLKIDVSDTVHNDNPIPQYMKNAITQVAEAVLNQNESTISTRRHSYSIFPSTYRNAAVRPSGSTINGMKKGAAKSQDECTNYGSLP
uniref:Drug/Metabolite Transporter (DMT) Superfamily putat n=1 Tax=Albugo laibachii Nc14 TaxID=890382 RepID=F0W8U2_9STRA|nr:Drug/Metabolite Transporter (DMT) Superfamily putat [Albugo laibachii Nc14]|eukprot:CCA17551.1 Drug/Metabolite Transporter (DMT) Superfamily putat [Albugo laibachii Nc14]